MKSKEELMKAGNWFKEKLIELSIDFSTLMLKGLVLAMAIRIFLSIITNRSLGVFDIFLTCIGFIVAYCIIFRNNISLIRLAYYYMMASFIDAKYYNNSTAESNFKVKKYLIKARLIKNKFDLDMENFKSKHGIDPDASLKDYFEKDDKDE